MPSTGCEHLKPATIKKITAFRNESNVIDADFATYSCISCSFTGSFPMLEKHFTKTKHEFAVSSRAVWCGQCNDLVYDPALLVSTGRTVSAISSKPVVNGVKRKLIESNGGEDDSYLTTNTSQRPCGRTGVRGLYNLGETCYMNAVLQMMVHNPLLASYFLGMGHSIHTCPINRELEGKKEKGNESEEEQQDDDGVSSEEKKELPSCVACGMTEVFSDVTMVDQPIPAQAVNLLFASWKNIQVSWAAAFSPHLPNKIRRMIMPIRSATNAPHQHMSGKGQQDAQEWFMCIVDRLHEGVAQYVPSSNDTSAGNTASTPSKQCVCFFHKVFYGRYNSQITCDTCHTISSTEDEFSSISLDFKKQAKKRKKAAKEAAAKEAAAKEAAKDDATSKKDSKRGDAAAAEDLRIQIPTLRDMLRAFTAPEPLSPDQYHCTSCNDKRSAKKQTRIRKLPALLCVHVKRFGMTASFAPEKYEGKIDFSLTLDMAPYTTRPPPKNGDHRRDARGKNGGKKDNEFLYDLDCVVVHQGEHAQNGHYFAFCRQDNKWFRFDDEIVSATTTEDVMRQEAYLLFYSLRSLERV
jgi:ubiquitin carboxyl-terminal hydrolase 22/27/51